eukprot:72983-Rhodomonas_salina.1
MACSSLYSPPLRGTKFDWAQSIVRRAVATNDLCGALRLPVIVFFIVVINPLLLVIFFFVSVTIFAVRTLDVTVFDDP